MKKAEIISLSLPYPGLADRKIRVYLPEREDGETLPVIYMTDGQNLFDEETSTFGCWHVVDTMLAERENSGKSAIIVGVHNDDASHPLQRTKELTPAGIGPLVYPPEIPEEIKSMLDCEGEIFDSFVIDTVMPAIEARFPVKTGRENTAFCGSSSGGLQAFFTALSHPDLFCAAGVLSPAFELYRPEDIESWIKAHIGGELPYLYIYSGGGDDLERRILDSVELTCVSLDKYYPSDRFTKIIMPEKPHHESAWEPVFADFLREFLNGDH